MATSAIDNAKAMKIFNRQIVTMVRDRVDRRRAIASVTRENPTLHEQFLRATNPRSAVLS